ncbi:unnamed protein product [Mytilus coruscus]|uniref:Reverse transcriptase domain-containing protein n=1 Tax=Mytilus coruscus TaxID=42192 RepID=A0A6J8AJL8_MYTCO|nr:unnamed protein product [Mytilus coruscus]
MIRRRATMYDTGLNELRDFANTIVTLPLTADGIVGSRFDAKMKEKTDRNKQLAEVLPDTRRVTLGAQLVKSQDWALSHDLKDAYLHIPVHKTHRKFLRFCIQGKCYQFVALCFGPSQAPRVFTKIINVVAAHLRIQNILLATYLDEWLLVNAQEKMLISDREKTLSLLIKLGFIVNLQKSSLIPSQEITYIGALFNFKKEIVSPTMERILKLEMLVRSLMKGHNTARYYLMLLGFIASCIELIPNVKEAYPITSTSFLETLHQRSHLSNSIYTTRKKSFEFVVGQTKHYQGQIITPVVGNRHNNNRCFKNGVWGSLEQSDFSRFLVCSRTETTNKSVGIGSCNSNSTTFPTTITKSKCAAQMRQHNSRSVCEQTGGTKSIHLCYKAWCLMKMAIQNNLTIRAAHIAGKLNIPANHLSRYKIQPTEWTLNNQIVQSVFAMWGEPTIDLFASVHNHKRPVFCTWLPHSNALAVDALSISWEKMWAYAFPPICLIPKVLKHISQFKCRLILIAPMWPRRHWYTELLPKSFASPIKLPTRQNLLYQPNTTIYHPNPEVFKLTAWQLSTTISEIRDFQEKLESFSEHHGDRAHTKTMLVNSKDLIVVVLYTSGLQYRTIAGCRSMLSSLLPPIDNVPIGQHPYMIRLLRGVFNSRPPKVNLVPEWDLQKVLDMLQKSPFEPLLKADVKCLTYKVVFLTAITTFRRCSDIQALRIGEGFVNVQKKGLVFLRPGLSKQDRPNHYGTKIFVPYFEHNKKLDP